jgi:hypothetical protein
MRSICKYICMVSFDQICKKKRLLICNSLKSSFFKNISGNPGFSGNPALFQNPRISWVKPSPGFPGFNLICIPDGTGTVLGKVPVRYGTVRYGTVPYRTALDTVRYPTVLVRYIFVIRIFDHLLL